MTTKQAAPINDKHSRFSNAAFASYFQADTGLFVYVHVTHCTSEASI